MNFGYSQLFRLLWFVQTCIAIQSLGDVWALNSTAISEIKDGRVLVAYGTLFSYSGQSISYQVPSADIILVK